MKIILISFILLISFGITKSQIVINEIVASNFRNHHDEDYDDSDWLELYNKSDKPVNLKDWKIFDKNEIENAFILPDTVLHPKEKIVIFASGKNRYTSNKIYARTSGLGMMAHVKGTYVHYLYIPMNEDFEAELQVDNVNSEQLFPTAGILFKEKLETHSKFYSIVVSNRKRETITTYYGFNEEKNPLQYLSGFTESPVTKIKLIKEGNVIKSLLMYHDAFTWFERSSDTLDFNSGYLGISFGGEDFRYELFADFIVSNFKINGKEFFYNDLEKTDIGLKSNISSSNILNEIHTNFAISKDGESIYLWNEKQELIDKVSFETQYTNLTYSRFPDGENKFYFSEPTPRKENISGLDSILTPPYFSEKSTIGTQLNKVEIEHETPNVEIYYTLDGSEPTKESFYYQNQILLDTGVVIRTKAFLNNAKSFNDEVFTYLPEYNYDIPLTSIIVDTLGLYNEDNGIINEKNLRRKYETKGYFDYINDTINYKTKTGIRIHGGGTRYFYPQKSFRFYSRYVTGDDYFNFQFWKNNNKKTYKFLLKNGGQDWERIFIRDLFSHHLVYKYLTNLDYASSNLTLSFINGKYYGISDFKERIDEDFLAEKYNINDKNNLNLVMNNEIKNGKIDSLYKYFKNFNESISPDSILNNFDLINILEYSFIRIFTAADDWPITNELKWQSDEYDKKWRWIPNDFDLSMEATHNSFVHSNTIKRVLDTNSHISLIMNKLFEENSYKYYFANFFADQLNKNFKPSNTIFIFDSLINIIKPVVLQHRNNYQFSLINFENQVENVKYFLKLRPQFLFQHIVEEFNYSGTDTITLSQNIENAGRFQVNSIEITESSWTGTYFNEVPISVSVKSNPGFRFIGWENLETSDSVLTDIYITQINKFNALFEKTGEPIEVPRTEIVINEIMFRPAENQQSGDWIEIYNNGNIDVDLSNWQLKDDNNSNFYIIPEGTILRKNDFMILSDKPLRFREYYGLTRNVIGGFDFGFGEDDMVRLFDDKNQLIDIVNYVTFSPLTDLTNRTGNTLELIHPNLENNISLNWKSSDIYGGTPLENNSIMSSISSFKTKFNHYPNPVKDYLHIENYHGNIKINIYDFNGKNIKTIETLNSNISINFSEHNSGLYVIKILDINNNLLEQLKIIKK